LGVSISVSTKAELSDVTVQDIASISSELESNGHVLKVGISFSTKNIDSLEPGTAAYDLRIRNLQMLHHNNIACCAIIKPILRDQPVEEYISIVQDCRPYTKFLLIGDEYVDADSVVSGDEITYRRVNWLKSSPLWPVRETKLTKDTLLSFAQSIQYEVYESDLDLMERIVKQKGDSHASIL
jgi:hypothetical protein